MPHTHELPVYRGEDDEIELTAHYTISKYYPAVVSGPADNWCPAEGGEVEIRKVTDSDGKSVDWTDVEDEMWTLRIQDNHDFSDDGFDPDYARDLMMEEAI